jgi:cytochrome c-type biogenesis protein CcmH/NrfF
MGASARFTFWTRGVEVLALAAAVYFSLGATDASSRFNNLGHRLMCTCSCAQLLGECNHVGCPESGRERNELAAAIASGSSDQQILDGFAAKYGATMLAAPTTKGFDLLAWVAPFAVFAAALLGTILLIKRWGGLGGKSQVAIATGEAGLDPSERERLERIRRETDPDAGGEGGF